MAHQVFYPTSEGDRIVWLANYQQKITAHGVHCGLSKAEVADTVADLVYYIWVLQVWHPAVQKYMVASTFYKNQLASPDNGVEHSMPVFPEFPNAPPARPAGILDRLFNQIQRIKMNAGYNDSIGHDLGIIASGAPAEHPYPDFSLSIEQGADNQIVSVGFPKYGHDGVWIEGRRNGGAWEFLAVSNKKPYMDKRA